ALLERHEPFFDFEIQRSAGRGRASWLSISGLPMLGENARFLGYRGIGRDITKRKRVHQLLALDHAVARCLADADSAPEALKAVIRTVCKSEGWDFGRYFRIDDEAGVLRLEEFWSAPGAGFEKFIEDSRAVVYPSGAGLAGRVWKSGKPLWSADFTRDPRALTTALARESGVHGGFVFALTSRGRPIGVLAFNSREIREPDDGLLQAVRSIGSQIGQFLTCKRAEEELHQGEERFRRLTILTSDTYWEQDEQYRFTLFTGAGKSWVGEMQRKAFGKRRWDMEHLNMSAADWRAHIAVCEAHQPFQDLELCRIEAGKMFWISVSGEPVFDESGAFKGYRGVGKNISARKRAQQLRELEHAVAHCLADADNAQQALKAVIRAICETESWDCGRFFRADTEAGVLRFEEFWGVPGAAIEKFIERSRALTYPLGAGLAGRVWQTGEPVWSDDTSRDPRVLMTALAQESGIHGAFVLPVTSEGKAIGILSFNTREIREPDEGLLQAVRVIGGQIGQFLTRKYAEEDLRQSEERFRRLTMLTSDTYWEQDEQFRFTSFTGTGKEWIDAVRSNAIGKRRWEMNYLNMSPTDWQAHIAACEAHLPYYELKLCMFEGGRKLWISVSGEPVFEQSGAFKGYRGVGKDITDRVLAEEELRRSEERFRSLTGLMSDGYWEIDEEFRFTFLSAGIENARFESQELLGKRPWESEAMYAGPEQWSALREDLRAHRPFQEFVFTRASGGNEARHFSISGLPIFDAAGAFCGYHGLARDITEKFRTQEHVQYLAYHDELTGLRSRSFFVEALARAIEQARRAGRRLALVFIDLDDFKQVNDTHGHAAGDRVLKEVAARLTASFRKGDLIARLGGDEFVVLIEDRAERHLLGAIANKVLAEVVKPCTSCATEVRVTASIGISVFPDDAGDENDLIQKADAAMYSAKSKGKNVVGFFSAAAPE
ncbi:MAG: diguanylate cyclase, partial [Betaproteobacteria bacterium]|nr:diguanylate cyclase [Betaproteobacteria bacterium]